VFFDIQDCKIDKLCCMPKHYMSIKLTSPRFKVHVLSIRCTTSKSKKHSTITYPQQGQSHLQKVRAWMSPIRWQKGRGEKCSIDTEPWVHFTPFHKRVLSKAFQLLKLSSISSKKICFHLNNTSPSLLRHNTHLDNTLVYAMAHNR